MSALGLTACSTVYVQDSTGAVRVERGWGVVSVMAPPGTTAQAVDFEGAGLVRTPDGFVLGYYNGSILTASADCRIVLWVRSEQDVRNLADLIAGRDVCIADARRARESDSLRHSAGGNHEQ